MLIILPGHLQVSGVTTWAMRAIHGLRARGIDAGLIVHCATGEHPPAFLKPYVVGVVEDAPSMDEFNGCLDQLIPVYLNAIKGMNAITNKPVVVAPNLHGDCFGAIAAIARDHPSLVRVAAWIHSDNNYDIAVCRHFEQMIHAFVPVSAELGTLAKQTLPNRESDIAHLAHGVNVPKACPTRKPIEGRPVRLLYTGRIEEYQKRISVLPLLSRYLDSIGIDHQLRIIGDGPEMNTMRESSHACSNIELLGSIPPEHINAHLQWADAWVLPSRFEGQSIAMLEAMAQGCTPVVTRVRSGADDAVIHEQSGLCIDAQWDTPTAQIAMNMGDAIAKLTSETLYNYSHGAHQIVSEHHSTQTHVDALAKLTDRIVPMPDRPWPSERRPSYTAPLGELSGSTPPYAAQRMENCLHSLKGKSVLIFGCGQHTKDIRSTIEQSGTHIAGIIDDNPELVGKELFGCRVYAPDMLHQLGATDLIISSYIHENTIWNKRASLEAQGVRVHRLYDDSAIPTAD